jgi:LacI family transcriptional regulator
MTHRFPIKEIAAQSGLGTATVDRVINNRAHVSAQTRGRVAIALQELEAQEAQLAARGRRMFFDFVVEAPQRFSDEVRRASLSASPLITSAVCRPRFTMQSVMSEVEVTQHLRRIIKRGSQGVCLKARNTPTIAQAVDQVVAAGIPVVTLVTDIPSQRSAYVGLDNAAAGRTAAFLIARSLDNQGGIVLTTKSQDAFLGEEERQTAFLTVLGELRPDLDCVDALGGSGLGYETAQALDRLIPDLRDIKAVYSMGGGNQMILNVLADHGLKPQVYVAHDFDHENRTLVQSGTLDFVLHHDLHADIHAAYLTLLHHHRLISDAPVIAPSNVQIITRFNLP